MTTEQSNQPQNENTTCLDIGGPEDTYDELRDTLKEISGERETGPLDLGDTLRIISDYRKGQNT